MLTIRRALGFAALCAIQSALCADAEASSSLDPPTAAASGDSISAHEPNSSPIVIKEATDEFVVGADGLFTETIHEELQPQSEAAARKVGQQTIRYSSSMVDTEVLEAYTAKVDGRRLPVDPTSLHTQIQDTSAQGSLYSDLVQTVILFPEVAAHDVVVYTARKRAKAAYFPGQFLAEDVYPRTTSLENVRVKIVMPRSMALRLEAQGVEFRRSDFGDNVAYEMHYAAPDALATDLSPLSIYDRAPRYFASTFPDYATFSRTYATLVEDKTVPSDAIRTLADTITAGVANRRQQAQKIYEWVSSHVRYVAVELGRGNIEPHKAEVIANNG